MTPATLPTAHGRSLSAKLAELNMDNRNTHISDRNDDNNENDNDSDSQSIDERPLTRSRTNTNTIIDPFSHPGSVRINVQDAYIIDGDEEEEPDSSVSSGESPFESDSGHDLSFATDDHIPESRARRYTRDIRLPNHKGRVSHLAVDIGGTLAKVVYYTPSILNDGGRLSFLCFETERIDDCIAFMQEINRRHSLSYDGKEDELCIMATGGGAYKYYDKIRKVLNVEIMREDEMECLIVGLNFFISEIPQEVFTYSDTSPMTFVTPSAQIYPYLLVNIGSGVSMIKVTGPSTYVRVGGTSLGGGTFWGLLSLLTGARSFDEMLELARRGDNTGVDMLVGDIYGANYSRIGLKSTHIASSFGKVFRLKRDGERDAEDGWNNGHHHHKISRDGDLLDDDVPDGSSFRAEDMALSLLYAVSNNIGQIAYLHAALHDLKTIYFGGSFIRGQEQTMAKLSFAINFWSKGEMKAYFVRHEGYLGATGAFLRMWRGDHKRKE